MGLLSFFNQLGNNTINQDDGNNLSHNLKKNKDKQITYENLRCSNIPKELRNLFFEFYTKFIQDSTSNTSSVNTHISLQNFIEILIHRNDLPFFIPIVSFIYINRFLQIPNSSIILSKFTPNRLIAVAIIIASKYYLEDTIYIKNSKWISKVCMGLFKTGELNSLESLFLQSIDYNINISYLEWQEYLEKIDNGLHELRLKYNYISGKEFESEDNVNSLSSIQQPIKNIKQLFLLLDNHILNNNQLISYDPSLEPNFSILYNLLESPSNSSSTLSSPQTDYIQNNEIEKIKDELDTDDNKQNNKSSSYNDKEMDEDRLEEENNNKKGRMEKQDNYQYTGILTPPSSSSSSSSQSVKFKYHHQHHLSSSSSSSKSNRNDPQCDIDIDVEEEKNSIHNFKMEGLSSIPSNSNKFISSSNSSCNSNTYSDLSHSQNQYTTNTPNSQPKQNTLSSLYQHNVDLKNSLENYSLTGRLTAGHSNHYSGNRYHPFSRSNNKNTTSETKRNGLPLFSPVKNLDKPVTVVSPYVYSLLNNHSKSKSGIGGCPSDSSSEAQSEFFVSPIPNTFNEHRCSNAIRSFSIIDNEDQQMMLKKNRNQMSVEDIASKYSITKSKNTREYNNKDRLNKSSNNNNNRSLLSSYSSRSRKHRHSLSSAIKHSSTTTNSSSNTSFSKDSTLTGNTTTSKSNNSSISSTEFNSNNIIDTNIINFGLGISKKSRLISKNTKINIPKIAKNQKLITSYLTMMDSTPEERSHCTPSSGSPITTASTTFLKRFPSITKFINRFNIRKEKKTVS